jgi:hypothetical protein
MEIHRRELVAILLGGGTQKNSLTEKNIYCEAGSHLRDTYFQTS